MALKIDARQIHEIVGLYKLEPSLIYDVYVEGIHDQVLLNWYFSDVGNVSRKVYTIDTVEVPDEVMGKYGLPARSNRNKILVLGAELESLGVSIPTLILLVDRDLDDVAPPKIAYRGVDVTDVGSMDVYLLHQYSAAKLATFIARDSVVSPDAIFSNALAVARKMYVIRGAVKLLDIHPRFFDLSNLLSLSGNVLSFDDGKYLENLLVSSGNGKHIEALKDKCMVVEKIISEKSLGDQITVHGHDLLKILSWYLRALGCRVDVRAEESLRYLLLMALTPGELNNWPLFIKLNS